MEHPDASKQHVVSIAYLLGFCFSRVCLLVHNAQPLEKGLGMLCGLLALLGNASSSFQTAPVSLQLFTALQQAPLIGCEAAGFAAMGMLLELVARLQLRQLVLELALTLVEGLQDSGLCLAFGLQHQGMLRGDLHLHEHARYRMCCSAIVLNSDLLHVLQRHCAQ